MSDENKQVQDMNLISHVMSQMVSMLSDSSAEVAAVELLSMNH